MKSLSATIFFSSAAVNPLSCRTSLSVCLDPTSAGLVESADLIRRAFVEDGALVRLQKPAGVLCRAAAFAETRTLRESYM